MTFVIYFSSVLRDFIASNTDAKNVSPVDHDLRRAAQIHYRNLSLRLSHHMGGGQQDHRPAQIDYGHISVRLSHHIGGEQDLCPAQIDYGPSVRLSHHIGGEQDLCPAQIDYGPSFRLSRHHIGREQYLPPAQIHYRDLSLRLCHHMGGDQQDLRPAIDYGDRCFPLAAPSDCGSCRLSRCTCGASLISSGNEVPCKGHTASFWALDA